MIAVSESQSTNAVPSLLDASCQQLARTAVHIWHHRVGMVSQRTPPCMDILFQRRSLRRSLSMIQTRKILLGALALVLLTGISLAQFGGRRGFGAGRSRAGEFLSGDEPIQPLPADREGVPDWKLDPHFKHDAFTFVRL